MASATPAAASTSAEAATSHHHATAALAAGRRCCGACTGASSVMLTRLTVVPRTVRLATPSLTCEPYLYGRRGVAGFASFPKDQDNKAQGRAAFSPRTGPRTPFLPPDVRRPASTWGR